MWEYLHLSVLFFNYTICIAAFFLSLFFLLRVLEIVLSIVFFSLKQGFFLFWFLLIGMIIAIEKK